MNGLVKPLADGIDIRLETEVTAISRVGNRWRVETAAGEESEPFDLVVSTAPAPQAQTLLGSEPGVEEALSRVSIAPCWALMLTFETPLNTGFDVWRSPSNNLAWMARNSSKPARGGRDDCWIVHASPQWSRQNLELDKEHAATSMIEMLSGVLGEGLPEIGYATAHRWRYALTTVSLGEPFYCSDDRTLFVGGDWCLGARVEYAFESGQAMANAVIGASAE